MLARHKLMEDNKTFLERLVADEVLFPLTVHHLREDDLVATIIYRNHVPSKVEFGMGTAAFSADETLVTADTFHTMERINPDTQREWDRGEMQEYFEKHGPDNGAVTEALVCTGSTRDGELYGMTFPYTRAGGHVLWGNPHEPDELGGLVINKLRVGFTLPTMIDKTIENLDSNHEMREVFDFTVQQNLGLAPYEVSEAIKKEVLLTLCDIVSSDHFQEDGDQVALAASRDEHSHVYRKKILSQIYQEV